MNEVLQLLTSLRQRHIKLWVEGDGLRYSAPKGVLTPADLSQLKQYKQEILHLLSQPNTSHTPLPAGVADGQLSFAQERLWFLDQLEGGNPFYNVAIALQLEGELNPAALQHSLETIAQRHDILRTTYPVQDGQAKQRVAPEPHLPFKQVNLTHLAHTPAEQQQELLRLALAEARLPFNLASDPLFRATLLQLSPSQHALFLTLHHIVSDGWSMGVLVRECAALYTAFVQNLPNPLPPLPLQYGDFATWQRQTLQGEVLKKQLDYWVQQLANVPPELKLPTDFPRPPVQTFGGSSVQFTLPADLTQQLNQLSQTAGATLFMTLAAAFALLLGRYSQQQDVLFGTPIANRQQRELEDLIGFFVNTLVIRTNLTGNPTFLELLKQVRQTALSAYAHQDLPFEKLVDTLQPERDLSRNPLFQVMFALQNAPAGTLTLPNLTISPLETPRVSALFDMVLDMWETPAGLVGMWEYNSDLFAEATMQRLITHFQTLLTNLVANPHQPIDHLSFLPPAEKEQILRHFDGPKRDYPIHQTIPALFEQQVAQHPGRVAAVHNGQQVTYEQLNHRANQLAHALRHVGVQPNQFVALLAERSIDFLAAILGILKAGSAYIPIDPSYPPGRVQYMLTNSQTAVLITHSHHLPTLYTAQNELVASTLQQVILLDDQPASAPLLNLTPASSWGRLSGANPAGVNSPRDRAYMLYTSGSTGLPKGAIIRHDGAINHIFAEYELLTFHDQTAFLQSAPSSSDISVWQFLAPVLGGGRTVIADLSTISDPPLLLELLQTEKITLIELVPVVLKAFLDHVKSFSPEQRALFLDWAMVTGEAVSVALVNQWLETYPHIKLVNAYGPTEAADDVTQAVIDRPLPLSTRSVPIGPALPNLTMYVLDELLQLVPIGVPGEICVAGIGVGEGYWHNPEKTAAAFVPNPYGRHEHDQILYRTGDKGRWLSNGWLEHIERIDQQVKVRGFRIECGEIEGVLDQHDTVEKNVVVVRPDHTGDKHLVAYVLPSKTGQAIAHQLDQLQSEQVALWQELHEKSYSDTLFLDNDPTLNVIGWDSNYTNQPLPAAEMHEYINHTVKRVLELKPQNLLEIGCGTGLIAFRLIPHCENYVGLDLSQVAIDQLNQLKTRPEIQNLVNKVEQATFLCQPADLVEQLPGRFDTVIFPSVVQYFPSLAYLQTVLAKLLERMPQGGAIFLGDVRNYHLLEAFHASVQAFKADPHTSAAELKQKVWQQLQQEQEMGIAPAFFAQLPAVLPAIAQVEILPKRGHHHNEMTRFRYDVVLHIGPARGLRQAQSPHGLPDPTWHTPPHTLAEITHQLTTTRPPVLALAHQPNGRLAYEHHLLQWLATGSPHETLQQFRTQHSALSTQHSAPLEPESLYQLAQETGYHLQLELNPTAADGALDLVFYQQGVALPGRTPLVYDGPLSNNPLQEKLARLLIPQWREFLKSKLPNHMVPHYFTVLDKMPLTPNGKIDREGMPPLETNRRLSGSGYLPPQTELEKKICAIWSEVLGVAEVGIQDNFFDLGGHSLKATQVVSRLQRSLGQEVPLRVLFNHPTVAELAAELTSPAGVPTYPPLTPTPPADHYPLSPAQHRLWVLSQLGEASLAYNMPQAILAQGLINRTALTQAFNQLVQRHEILRTSFVVVQGEPRQKVHPWQPFELAYLDLRHEPHPAEKAQELAWQEAQTPFDLTTAPLWRLKLLQIGVDQTVLLLTFHHLIFDAWSEAVLLKELGELYAAAQTHWLTDVYPPLPVQYRDYAIWQHQFLSTPFGEQQRHYWQNQLAGELPILDFPADFPRPAVKTYTGRTHHLHLSSPQTIALHQLSQQHQASLFMTLTALVNLLLYRYTGQEDILLGTPIAGRTDVLLEGQIGFYLNTLVLRTLVNGEQTFAELLAQVKEMTTQAYDHQAYPFDRLVDDLNLSRDVSRHPIFDVAIVLQNVAQAAGHWPDVHFSPFIEEYGGSKFDLSFTFEVREGELQLALVYNSDLYTAERITRLGHHFVELVTHVLAQPTRPLAEYNLLPPAERQLLLTFNQTADFSTPETIVSWVENIAAQYPEKTAVTFAQTSLTYAELNQQANQLAHLLGAAGVRPGQFVGVYLERSLEMVVAILGILKAGGAYVPVDPSSPADRIGFIFKDAAAQVVITQTELLENAPAGVKTFVFGRDSFATQPTHNPHLPLDTLQPAYMIYTSGSTGLPKGCMVSHHNVTRLFTATQPWYNFNEQDVWTLFHSYAFDFSVWELWGALFYGGRVVIVPQAITRDPAGFYQLLADEQITVLNQTPSAFRQLIKAEQNLVQPASLALRFVIFGGEALELQSLRPWFEAHGDERPQLVNMYGITETTVHVTYRPLSWADLERKASVIGRPIPDLQLFILDGRRQPVPIGMTGEIYVGGAGVSLGYWQRPELNAERFISDPTTGQRLYKSGDLARYLPDGDVEYLGRADTQVKIRGFRIELGEIEALCASYPAVQDVALVTHSTGADLQLVAYLVAAGLDLEALRQWLKQKLPSYMVPAHLIPLERLPLTSNGKLDRRALPHPAEVLPSQPKLLPQSALQQQIAAAWEKILKRPGIGLQDNFFDLGGNSLTLIQVYNQLKEQLPVELEVVELFQYPTIEALAHFVEQKQLTPLNPAATLEEVDERVARQKAARQRRGNRE